MTVHPRPAHDSACDALGCGVTCPIAAMLNAIRHHAPCPCDKISTWHNLGTVCPKADMKAALAAAEVWRSPMNENRFFVGARGDEIVILLPPLKPISRDDAINLAAWLVAVADVDEKFPQVLAEVRQ